MTDTVADILAHYGVKGMHWGVRKDRSPTNVEVVANPGKRAKATGGKNQSASEDAKAAAAARQKAKASTIDSLSNQELQQLVNRMNLEQQYARLSVGQKSAGRKFAEAFIGDVGKRKFSQYANEAVTGNEDLGIPARPKLKPIVDSLDTALNKSGGKKKNK